MENNDIHDSLISVIKNLTYMFFCQSKAKFVFHQKFYFCSMFLIKITIFGENVDCWRKCFLIKLENFDENFFLLSKLSNFDENFLFLPKLSNFDENFFLFPKLSTFNETFDFYKILYKIWPHIWFCPLFYPLALSVRNFFIHRTLQQGKIYAVKK